MNLNSKEMGTVKLNSKEVNFVEKLYNKMFDSLYAYALHSLCDSTLSEEAVQDTFLIACTKIEDMMQSQNPEGWLTNVLKNVILNIWHRQAKLATKVIPSSPFDEAFGDAIHTDEENIDIIFSNLVHDRDYILLKKIVLEKCTMEETAAYFNISIDACKKRVQRAKKRLNEFPLKYGII